MLRPELLSSERWNLCSPMAQTLYVRLLMLVDDWGRFDANPRLLASMAFPLGDSKQRTVPVAKVEEMLAELVERDMLRVFVGGNGSKCLQLKRWRERVRAATSKYPDPSDAADACAQLPAYDRTVRANVSGLRADVVECPPPSPSPSPSPAPTPSPSPAPSPKEREKGGGGLNGDGDPDQERLDWAVLKNRMVEIEKRLDDPELEAEQRSELIRERKKTRRALEALVAAQVDAAAKRVRVGD